MSDDELLEGLHRLNPVRTEEIAGAVDAPRAEALLESIVRAPSLASNRRWAKAGLRRFAESTGFDELEALGAANPVPLPSSAAFTPPGEAERRAALIDSIIGGTYEHDPGRSARPATGHAVGQVARIFGRRSKLDDGDHPSGPRRVALRSRRAIVLPIFAATVLAVSATAVVIAREHATKPASTACFEGDNYGAGSESTIVTGSDSIAACAAQWFHGAFGAPRRPNLVACILPSGFVGVFPGRNVQVCAKLNLSVALAPSAHTTAIARLHVKLDHDIEESKCVNLDAARAIVKADLATFGLAGWHIVLSGKPTRGLPCTTTAIILPHTVALFLTPKPVLPPPKAN